MQDGFPHGNGKGFAPHRPGARRKASTEARRTSTGRHSKVARIYVTLAADGRTANFKFTPDEQELKRLLLPAAFAPVPNAWGQQGWTTGTLSKMPVADLEAALQTAWLHARSKPRKSVKALSSSLA